jgi:NTP pyrophosphatase (non-canonical NTP hydrolase)
MELNEYQGKERDTAIYPGKGNINGLVYVALGLGESGEFQGKVKKILRDDNGVVTEDHKKALAFELSDILWYIAMSAEEVGYSLEEIAQMNIDKLASRKERNTLGGSGDNR